MKNNIIIPNPENLNKIAANMRAGGPDKLHILSDFDKTLTRAVVDGQASPSVIAQLRNNKILEHADYSRRANALFDKYHRFETDPRLDLAERTAQMKKWWNEHHQLLIECGINQKSIDEVVAKRTLKFRDGALNFIDALHARAVPLVIMSAAPAYMIARYLSQDGRLYDNVKIIANWYVFDDAGQMVGVREPVIHSLNKREITLDGFPEFEKIRDRKNVVLLGDNPEDIEMVTGFDYENLIKIGFYNQPTDERLSDYQRQFDAVITGDGDMAYVNQLLQSIIS